MAVGAWQQAAGDEGSEGQARAGEGSSSRNKRKKRRGRGLRGGQLSPATTASAPPNATPHPDHLTPRDRTRYGMKTGHVTE